MRPDQDQAISEHLETLGAIEQRLRKAIDALGPERER
jgi:hypothetical protein